ncbi:hypothetical protein [Microvirga tunisiensis]|uniref:Peptidase S7 domain-containing protein n=1 Tax=Microvirga tunisiensis TaxID=2108360 RepID=A0A5N7MKT1_9HYPH|nr:hypothetical protein [Microvirga tunisiensis]MPR27049.1 hypothetical protein [Microvirga tunisiensis]
MHDSDPQSGPHGSSGGPVLNSRDEVVGLYSRSSPNGNAVSVTLDGLQDLL